MRGAIIILVLLLAISSAMAVSGPKTVNGKQYYVVTSTDSTEDTGNEVCAKVGMACIGYTDTTNSACQAFNPTAASSSGVNGDAAGVYCNGAPQNGVCGVTQNTCVSCPSCSASVDCSTPIGGLYREMYVECQPGQCKVSFQASTVQDLINQIPSINAQLQGCPQSVPAYAKALFKNGVTQVDILMNNGQTQSITITMANGVITGVTAGAPASCSQKITVSENDLNTALQSQSPSQAYAYLYGQGKIKVSGCTFFKSIGFFFGNMFAKPVAKKAAPAPPPPKPAPNCGQVGEQCNNRGCFSGMCGAPRERNSDGAWGFWNHRCLDQNEYTANCIGRGNSPAPYNCYTGACS